MKHSSLLQNEDNSLRGRMHSTSWRDKTWAENLNMIHVCSRWKLCDDRRWNCTALKMRFHPRRAVVGTLIGLAFILSSAIISVHDDRVAAMHRDKKGENGINCHNILYIYYRVVGSNRVVKRSLTWDGVLKTGVFFCQRCFSISERRRETLPFLLKTNYFGETAITGLSQFTPMECLITFKQMNWISANRAL